MTTAVVGRILHVQGAPITSVYFPNGGVYSVITEMRDGELIEVATVGLEGMLGLGVFLGDPLGAGRTILQVPNGSVPSMPVANFVQESTSGRFHDVVALYVRANGLQVMQSAACNALHDVQQRCCRWLLETQDRVGASEFLLKQEFLAIMLGVQRPTVTRVIGVLQQVGAISSRYGRIRVLKRRTLQARACECHDVVKAHFQRLGLQGS
jgi:CRP-like cAMP-binding protein